MSAKASGRNLLAIVVWDLSPSPQRTTKIATWLFCGPENNLMAVHASYGAADLLDIVTTAKSGRESLNWTLVVCG